MGRSRSRRRDKDHDKEKERKRSRSRRKEKDHSKRDRSEKRAKEPKEPKAERPPPERQRSPSFQYRRWRFDSPPKDEEYQRDAMLTGNPMGLGGVAAALQGGLALAGLSNTVSPLALAADTKAMRELYVGNLPGGITAPQLVQFLNQVAQAVKVNSLPGEPVLGATMGGGGLFAFVEFRTAEEAANGLRLNGVELLGCQLKVGRPKGYTGPETVGGAGGALALPGVAGQLALPSSGSTPSLGDMMAQAGALGRSPGQLALPGLPGAGGANSSAVVSAIDHRLCLVNIPTFVGEDRIRELLVTFGQLKFFALQKDEDQKSVGVAFFEFADMMTQQQARAQLEGLELGAKKLSVKKPDEVIEMGLVARVQKLGHRVVPSKVIYLKNIVTAEELRDDSAYEDVCADIRLEGEKFGAVVSMEVPRGRGPPPDPNAEAAPAALTGGMMALEDTRSTAMGAQAKASSQALLPKASPPAKAAPPLEPANPLAIVPAGAVPKAAPPTNALAHIGGGASGAPGAGGLGQDGGGSGVYDENVPGVGFAFVEFATIEGSSKAKKALNGRRFGQNLVECEYFSEDKYYAKDFADPKPNTTEPKRESGTELALYGQGDVNAVDMLDEAPVMVE